MKLVLERWNRFVNEAEFHDSPDEDGPGNRWIILFNPEDEYKLIGYTHGGLGHMIKHYIEFEPSKVMSGLKQALQKANTFNNFILRQRRTGESFTGDEAKKKANEKAMLNTFDFINDKIKNNERLRREEEQLFSIIKPLNQGYQQLVDSYLASSRVDIDKINDPVEIKKILDARKMIKFIGVYKKTNELNQYFLNLRNTGMVAVSSGDVKTLFRIHKTGASLERVANYLRKFVELKNPAFDEALASYIGTDSQPKQQKKKQKPQQQKSRAKPGDIVKRLKAAKKSDDQIRQILSKAFPNLPEKTVDNMIANVKA